MDVPILPQILADVTSITPLSSAISFHYNGQIGDDAGGMWSRTLTLLFNDLLAEQNITNEILDTVKGMSKFSNREL